MKLLLAAALLFAPAPALAEPPDDAEVRLPYSELRRLREERHPAPPDACLLRQRRLLFHLLFAYLVDLLSPYASSGIATAASLLLVAGYLRSIGGKLLFRVAVPAQLNYLTLFSLSFFPDGLTGITLAVVPVLTLALLMMLTAKNS